MLGRRCGTHQHNSRADRLVSDETRPRDSSEEDPAQVSELLGSPGPEIGSGTTGMKAWVSVAHARVVTRWPEYSTRGLSEHQDFS